MKSLDSLLKGDSKIFKPTPYLNHPFLQSVYNLAQPTINLPLQREKIYFQDGGHVSLDWSAMNKESKSSPPILFIMHGLTGGSQMNYMRVLVKEATDEGYLCVCLNSRGINNQMTSPIPFTGISFHELETALQRISIYYPDSPIYLVGASFGGNYLIRYLLQHHKPNIHGLIALAPPFNVGQVVDDMPLIYEHFFVKRYIQQTVFKHPIMNFWQQIGLVDLQSVKDSKTLRQFHSRISVKIIGLESVHELFNNFTITDQQIQSLKVPTLLMLSQDDPIVSYSSAPVNSIKKNPNLNLQVTERGGHLCWFQGIIPKRWYPKPALEFIQNLRTEKGTLICDTKQ